MFDRHRRAVRTSTRCTLIWLALAAICRAQTTLEVPAATLRPLVALAENLAKGQHEQPCRTALAVLTALGHPQRAQTELDAACTKLLLAAKPQKVSPKELQRLHAESVAKLTEVFAATTSPDDRRTIAAQLVALDDRDAAAHEALGHVLAHGRYVETSLVPLFDREVAIEQARRDALVLSLEPSRVTQSDVGFIEAVLGQPGVLVEGHGMTVHTTLGRDAARQVFVDFARALAFAGFLTKGELAPERLRPIQCLFVDTRERYGKLLDVLVRDGRMPPEEASGLRKASFFWDPRNEYLVMRADDPREFSAYLLAEALDRLDHRPQQYLRAGLANYVCLAMLARRLPDYRTPDAEPAASAADVTKRADDPLLRAESGLAGLDSYLTSLVQKGRDPAWSDCMRETIQDVRGDHLQKATGVMRLLCAMGPLDAPLRECGEADATDAAARSAQFAAAFGKSAADVDTMFRAWQRGASASIARDLDSIVDASDDRDRLSFRNELEALRVKATTTDAASLGLSFDAVLSRGAAAHARYVAALPKTDITGNEWHRPRTDAAEFSLAAMRAAAETVIAVDTDSASAALDAWLADLPARTRLLHPGLFAIGIGRAGPAADPQSSPVIAVDCGSLVRPLAARHVVRWPHDTMRKVPTHYVHGSRALLPDESSREWGYPISLQVYGALAADSTETTTESANAGVRLELWLGNPKRGSRVECFEISPDLPATTAAMLAPNTWALIPKEPLPARKSFTVVARFGEGGAPTFWTFQT